MTDSHTLINAVASLLLVLGLIGVIAVIFRRFANIGGTGTLPLQHRGTEKRLALVESLWLDGRHRMVVVRDGTNEYTLVLGPENALQLSQKQTPLADAK